MAIYTNTFEGGTNGATMTIGNSGGASGQAFDQVTANVTYTTDTMHGTLGATASGASTQYGRWSFTDGPALLRSYHKFGSVSDNATPVRFSLTSGAVSALLLNGVNAGRVQLYMGSGRGTSPGALTPDTWYRFELYVQPHASNGVLRLAVYEGDATTAWWDSGNVAGLAVADIVSQFIGKYDSAATQVTWDSVGLKTGADAVWGAWPYTVPATGPTITVSRPADNLVDLRSSTSGDSSNLTYPTPVRVSGPTLTVSSLADGLWLFDQDSVASAMYSVSVQQADGQTATENVTVPALATTPPENISAPLRLLNPPPSSSWG